MSWWSSFCGAQPFLSGSTKRLLCFPLDDAVVAGIAALAPAGSELASPADVESIAFTWEAVCIAPLRLNAPLPPCIRRGDFFVLRDDWMQVSFHSGVAGAGRSPSAERGRIRHRRCDPSLGARQGRAFSEDEIRVVRERLLVETDLPVEVVRQAAVAGYADTALLHSMGASVRSASVRWWGHLVPQAGRRRVHVGSDRAALLRAQTPSSDALRRSSARNDTRGTSSCLFSCHLLSRVLLSISRVVGGRSPRSRIRAR